MNTKLIFSFISLSFGVTALAGGCAVEPSDADTADPVAEDRGPIGKADLWGTCALHSGADRCGTKSYGNCWCDDLCSNFGDCCTDKQDTCDAGPPAGACGGIAGLTCGDDDYCDFGGGCSVPDQMGTCTPLPDYCPQYYAPVCGCDGETYSNACFATANGTGVDHIGRCQEEASSCVDTGCGEGSYCSFCWGSYQCVPNGAVC